MSGCRPHPVLMIVLAMWLSIGMAGGVEAHWLTKLLKEAGEAGGDAATTASRVGLGSLDEAAGLGIDPRAGQAFGHDRRPVFHPFEGGKHAVTVIKVAVYAADVVAENRFGADFVTSEDFEFGVGLFEEAYHFTAVVAGGTD